MTELPKPGDFVGGRYQIESLLGEGGMGAVFAAINGATGRPVAIKWMLPAMATSAEAVARFLAEARTTARIEHPNVIQILDVGQDGEAPFLVMERLRGESLGERLVREKRLPVDEALDIVLAACRGIAEAHSEGIIHRDLKPDNIFLCRSKDGTPRPPKVLDFGISKLFDDGTAQQQLTQTGAIMGTPLYMSPQQLDGRKTPDAGFDVYAMGVVLYETLSGRVPYNATTFFVLIQEIVAGNGVPLSQVAPWVPAELAAVVDRAMSPKSETRYQTMNELIAALTNARKNIVAGVTPPATNPAPHGAAPAGAPPVGSASLGGSTTGPFAHAVTGAPLVPASPAPRGLSAAMRWGIGAAAVAVLLIGVGVGAIVAMSRDDQDAPVPPTPDSSTTTPLPNQPPNPPIGTNQPNMPSQPSQPTQLRQPTPSNPYLPNQPTQGGAVLNLQAVGGCGPLATSWSIVSAQDPYISVSSIQPGFTISFDVPGVGELPVTNILEVWPGLVVQLAKDDITWSNRREALDSRPPVSGTISVSEFDVPTGRMRIELHDVTLLEQEGSRVCVLNGSVTTSGANI